jgi:prepilin peptidase CpaA
MLVTFQLITMALTVALLLWTAVHDVRTYTIPNRICLAVAGLALAWWAIGLAFPEASMRPVSWLDAAWQLGIAMVVFLLFFAIFATGAMGGGDVKLMGALGLWTPFPDVLGLLMYTAIVGGLIAGIQLTRRYLARRALQDGTEMTEVFEVPYGVAIAVGGAATLGKPILNSLLGMVS